MLHLFGQKLRPEDEQTGRLDTRPAGGFWEAGLKASLPFDHELDLTAGRQDLPQLGGAEAVGPPQGDPVWEAGDVQILRVHLEPRVRHLGDFCEAQSFS